MWKGGASVAASRPGTGRWLYDNHMNKTPWIAVSLCLLLPWQAASAAECVPVVRDAWIRLAPAGMPMHAGFARIANPCNAPVAIVGASSPHYARIDMHETRLENGVSSMRARAEVRVPARGQVQFKPGGLHWMLMRPTAGLQAGQTVAVMLHLADGNRLEKSFVVRQAGRQAASVGPRRQEPASGLP